MTVEERGERESVAIPLVWFLPGHLCWISVSARDHLRHKKPYAPRIRKISSSVSEATSVPTVPHPTRTIVSPPPQDKPQTTRADPPSLSFLSLFRGSRTTPAYSPRWFSE